MKRPTGPSLNAPIIPRAVPRSHRLPGPLPSRSQQWACGKCGLEKRFTRTVAAVVCGTCPQCEWKEWNPL